MGLTFGLPFKRVQNSLPSPESVPEAPSKNETTGQSVARATAGIGVLHLLRFIVGFIAQPLIAHNLGLRWHADVYVVSQEIVQRFWLVFEKVINPAFLPNFIAALKEEGEERAWRLVSTALWVLSTLLVMASVGGWFVMPFLVDFLSQKAGPEQIELTIQTARVLLLGLFFLGFSSFTYTILNGYKRFAFAAFGDAVWKFGVFVGAFAAFKLYGGHLDVLTQISKDRALTSAEESQILRLASQSLWLIIAGFVGGSVGKLVPHLWAIGPKWRLLRPKSDLNDPLARKMLLLAVPLLLGILVSELRSFYLQRLADDPSIQIEAGRAALKWSRIIGDNLIQVFPYALSIGIFPFLADLARERDRQPLTDTLLGALRICFFVFAPLTAILIALRFPLLRAVWESGRLTQSDTLAMSAPFVAFTIGLVAFACEMMLGQTFYAMTRAWTPTLIGIGTSLLWVVVATWGVAGLGWGLAAIAGAESLAKSVKCLVMWHLLKPHLGEVKRRENAVFALKVVAGAVLAALVAAFLIRFVAPDAGAARFKLKMLLAVTVSGLGAVGVFLMFASLCKIEETRALNRVFGKIAGRLRR